MLLGLVSRCIAAAAAAAVAAAAAAVAAAAAAVAAAAAAAAAAGDCAQNTCINFKYQLNNTLKPLEEI